MEKETLKNSKKRKVFRGQRGFTLVEILIVLLILGSMISISIGAFLSHEERSKVSVTKQRLTVIQESMKKFLEVNGRYPCVAPFTIRPGDAGFGLETDSDPNPNNISCQTGPGLVGIPGTLLANSGNPLIPGNGVRIGVVPFRTLNLPSEFAIDAWGGTLTYAVVRRLATEIDDTGNPGFSHAGGSISIIDNIGDPVINPPNSAHYIVLSHGGDQLGARVIESNVAADVKNDCNVAADPTPLQRENCDDDAFFILSAALDDLAVFDIQRRPDDILPAGTVLPFDSAECPQGWIEYMGPNGNRGRFLLGVDTAATQRNLINGPGTPVVPKPDLPTTPPTTFSTSRGVVTSEYLLGDVGEDGQENISPYLALRYCAKQ